MLNPETSSDSPLAKSNGVRLVSKLETNHTLTKGKKIQLQKLFASLILENLKFLTKHAKNKKLSLICEQDLSKHFESMSGEAFDAINA
jgi:hypothetical protein